MLESFSPPTHGPGTEELGLMNPCDAFPAPSPRTPPESKPATREQLFNAPMAELCYRPCSHNAKALTDHLLHLTLEHETAHHPRRQKWREADLRSFKQGLSAFAADLLIHAANELSGGTTFRSTHRPPFSDTLCSWRHFSRLVLFWREMGWIEVYTGFRLYGDFDGEKEVEMAKARRFQATPQFLRIAADHQIVSDEARKHFSKDHRGSFPIEVKTTSARDANGRKRSKRMEPPHSAKLNLALDQIRDLNAFLEAHSFSLQETPQFKRTFHNGDDPAFDYNMGGRLYCTSQGTGYQRFSKEERLDIRIDGEVTAEVDVSNSFLAIAHWSLDVPFDPSADLYAVEGIERDVVKKIVVARLGSDKWPERWPKGLKEEYLQKTGQHLHHRYKLKHVVEAVRTSIPILEIVSHRMV